MICETCSIHKEKFKTQNNYLAFKKELYFLVSEGLLKMLKQFDNNSPFDFYIYQCNVCKKKWLLSVPDNAFRGGWKELENE